MSWLGSNWIFLGHVVNRVQGVMERLLADIHTHFFLSEWLHFPTCLAVGVAKWLPCLVGRRVEVISSYGPDKPLWIVLEVLSPLDDWQRSPREPQPWALKHWMLCEWEVKCMWRLWNLKFCLLPRSPLMTRSSRVWVCVRLCPWGNWQSQYSEDLCLWCPDRRVALSPHSG